MYIMCVILCLFSALSRRVGTLQISFIIIIIIVHAQPGRRDIAQLVQRPTQKPGAILKQVRVLGPGKDFSPSQLSVHSYGVLIHAAPECNRRHQRLCACKQSRMLAAIPLFGHMEILHILT